MKEKDKKDKPKPGRKQWVIVQYVGNFIGCLIVTPMLAMVVFKFFSDGTGDLVSVKMFMLVFISCFIIIQCHGALVNMRRDFLRGRWVLGDDEASIEPDSVINPWRRIGPLALPAAIVTAAAIYFAVPFLGSEPFNRLKIDIMAFVPLYVVSAILIGITFPRDQVSFVTALSKPKPERPEPFFRYFFFEHIGPLILLQVAINLGIALKQFPFEAAKTGGLIPATYVAGDFGIVLGIIFFFMWVTSEGQVRPDVHLGRVPENAFVRSKFGDMNAVLVVILAIILSFGVMAVVGGVMAAVFYIAGLEAISVTSACVLKTIAAIVGCVVGCRAGIWWGSRRETALIRAESSDSKEAS